MEMADLGQVAEIERHAYAYPWSQGLFADCLHVGYRCWVGVLDDRIVGYGIMSVAVGECHILNICIDPDYQGLGLGRRLLRRMLRGARDQGADTAFLEVRPSNQVALDLYLSLGFSEVGVRPNYYPTARGRENALIMACAL
jgi:[ribosomal protein S18]-alanine N-acetyltransferase